MSATMEVTVRALLSGLGKEVEFNESFDTTTAPTAKTVQYRIQAVADTAEALDLGGVSTVHLIIIKSITNDLDVDADYSAAFDADIEVQEGEFAIFKPAGTVYVKNHDNGVRSIYEYVVVGVL